MADLMKAFAEAMAAAEIDASPAAGTGAAQAAQTAAGLPPGAAEDAAVAGYNAAKAKGRPQRAELKSGQQVELGNPSSIPAGTVRDNKGTSYAVSEVVAWLDYRFKDLWRRPAETPEQAPEPPPSPAKSETAGGFVLADSSSRMAQNARSFTRALRGGQDEPPPPTAPPQPPPQPGGAVPIEPAKPRGMWTGAGQGAPSSEPLPPPPPQRTGGRWTGGSSSPAGPPPPPPPVATAGAPPDPPGPPGPPHPQTKTLLEKLIDSAKKLVEALKPSQPQRTVAQDTAGMTWAQRRERLEKAGKLLTAKEAKERGLYQGEPTAREIVQQSEEAEQAERDRNRHGWRRRAADLLWNNPAGRAIRWGQTGGAIGQAAGGAIGQAAGQAAGTMQRGLGAAFGGALGTGAGAGARAGGSPAGTMASAAAGRMAGEVAGAAIGRVAGALASVAGTTLAFGAAAYGATQAVKKFGEVNLESMRELSKFSPVMAAAIARTDFHRMQLDAQYARATGGTAGDSAKALRDLMTEVQPMREMLGNLTNLGLTLLMRIAEGVAKTVNTVLEVGKAMAPDLQKLAETEMKRLQAETEKNNANIHAPAIMQALTETMQGRYSRPTHNREPIGPVPNPYVKIR